MKGFWNERYAEDGLAYGDKPNAYLVDAISEVEPNGKILVVGDGEGRNGVWLAKQGFDVTCVDYSTVAVEKITALAKKNHVTVNAICADLNEWDWPVNYFDAVVSIYVHFPENLRADLHKKMFESLVPGGKILMEGFNKDQLQYKSGGPPVLDMLFSESLLREDFSMATIKYIEEKIVHLDEGKYHCGDGAVVRMVAVKSS